MIFRIFLSFIAFAPPAHRGLRSGLEAYGLEAAPVGRKLENQIASREVQGRKGTR